ncbi:MAG: hypothetical protein ACLQVJ_03505 [Syntrophobacteraceae bacterium]
MKKVLFMITVLFLWSAMTLLSGNALAGWVEGYYRSNGTYVAPYYRSNPNSSVTDNYGFKGNINPYTGREGHNYYRSNPTSPYYDGTPHYQRDFRWR